MIISKKLSIKCIDFIKHNTSTSEDDLEKIHYGIQVIINNLFKLIILLMTAYLLGIFMYTFTAFIIFATLRCFASGVHANSTFQCILCNYILFFGNVYLSINLSYNPLINGTVFVMSFIFMLLYAPADTEERPLISKKLRRNLKIKSIIFTIVFYTITLLIKNSIYINLIIFAILEESLIITPLAYKLFGKNYKNYKNI